MSLHLSERLDQHLLRDSADRHPAISGHQRGGHLGAENVPGAVRSADLLAELLLFELLLFELLLLADVGRRLAELLLLTGIAGRLAELFLFELLLFELLLLAGVGRLAELLRLTGIAGRLAELLLFELLLFELLLFELLGTAWPLIMWSTASQTLSGVNCIITG